MRRIVLTAALLALTLPAIPVVTLADENPGSALIGDGTLYRSGLVERRDVFGGEAMPEPVSGLQPANVEPGVPSITLVSFSEATISRIEVAPFNARTLVWVMIGFAALLGIFLSARQISD